MIFVKSWISHPYKTQYHCSMLQWGTVFTNGCCSGLVGSITKVWQPFTATMHTRKMSDINDVLSKLWLDFCQILDFSPLQDSISVQHVAMRHCTHTNGCCSSLVGPITKVWQPFTIIIHTRKMSDINDVWSKLWLDFCQIQDFSPLQDSISVQHVAIWGTVFTNGCCSSLVGSITKV